MAMNKKVSEETFGTDPMSPRVSGGGEIVTFGPTVKEGQAIPDRGFSVNQKTGEPAKGNK